MKWFLMLGLLVACGNDGDAAPEGCPGLSLEACEDDATCALLELRPWSPVDECWKPVTAAACVPARATCAPISGCFLDGDGTRWLNDGDCVPEAWKAVSGDQCAGEPLCR